MTVHNTAPSFVTRDDLAPLVNRAGRLPAADPAPVQVADPAAPESRATTQAAPSTGRAAVNGEIRALATTFDLDRIGPTP